MQYAGGVTGPLAAPYIYAIQSRDLLYVGETQGHPVLRWGGHLQLEGSFRRALTLRGDPELSYLDGIGFHGFRCVSLCERFPQIEYKIATQAVEHQLHALIATQPSRLGGSFRLISDTEKTAPRRFMAWDFADELANKILSALSERLAADR